MKRIFCLILALLMVGSVLVSCGNTNTETPDANSDTEVAGNVTENVDTTVDATEETTTEATTEAETEPPAVMSEYDLSKFRIVYIGSHFADLAEDFKTQIKVKTGLELEVVASVDAKDEGGYEFIIGNTDREISKTCFDYENFKYVNYLGVYSDGTKVQMLGTDRLTIRDSIKYFTATLVEGITTASLPEEGAFAKKIVLADNDLSERDDPSYLRVITNNILMHSLTNKWGVPATQNRMSELMGAYLLMDPDIMMFQEVDELWFTVHKLVNNMKSIGYSYASKSSLATLSSAIFYKTSKFKLLETDSIIYDSSMLPGGPLEGRRYTYAVLEEKATGKQVVVTSTHFVWSISGVSTEVCELYRQESAKQLVAFSESIRAKYPGAVVIMGGDYNANLESEAHRIMTDSLLSARDTAEKQLNMKFTTSLSGVGKRPQRGNPPSVIDHIFYTKEGLTAKRYEVVVSRYSYAYSDHVPVLVDFEWK